MGKEKKYVINEEKQALPRPCAMFVLFAFKSKDFMIGIVSLSFSVNFVSFVALENEKSEKIYPLMCF